MRIFPLLVIFPTFALAEICPESPDISEQRDALLETLADTDSPETAQNIGAALWHLWRTAPDAQSQDLLNRGIARREAYDFADSEQILDELISYCPEYSEGYNQRAFTRFLRENYDASLEDLDQVLEWEPNHFGALSGKAIVFMRMGRTILGQAVLRRALEIHPWLAERSMLVPNKTIDL